METTCSVCTRPASVAMNDEALCGDCYLCFVAADRDGGPDERHRRCASCSSEIETDGDGFVCARCFRRILPVL